jgi:Cu+-exporting ATPase
MSPVSKADGGPSFRFEGNPNCGCSCDVCYCGPNCQCTETLCRCEASSVLNSLGSPTNRPGSASATPKPSCCAATNAPVTANGGEDPLARPPSSVEIGIRGMTCSMCTRAVEQALRGVPGVSHVAVTLATHSAYIDYDDSILPPLDGSTTTPYQEFLDAVESIGFEAEVLAVPAASETTVPVSSVVEFSVSGMTCSMCTQAIQRVLEGVEGVQDVSVALSTNVARVEFDDTRVTSDQLKEHIEDIGYEVVDTTILAQQGGGGGEEVGSEDRLERLLQQQQREVRHRKRAFLWSLVGTLPILVMTMVFPHISDKALEDFLHQPIQIGHSQFILEALVLWTLCTPIQFGCGWAFYKSSWYGLRQGVLGMDVLVSVGTSASYGYAVWATLAGSMEYHFFETSAVLICFILLGKWLQCLAVRRTSQALTQLLALQPKTAIQVVMPNSIKDGSWDPLKDPYQEQVVPSHSIHTGDMVKILKGASIPADGVVKFGEMSVDESMITGESVPVLKIKFYCPRRNYLR